MFGAYSLPSAGSVLSSVLLTYPFHKLLMTKPNQTNQHISANSLSRIALQDINGISRSYLCSLVKWPPALIIVMLILGSVDNCSRKDFLPGSLCSEFLECLM